MSFARCTSSLGCPESSLEEMLALAERHDIGAIELRALGGTVELGTYFSEHYGSPARLAERMRASRVRIVSFNGSLHLVGPTAAEREHLLSLMPWAEALGVPWIRAFDGGSKADDAEFAEASRTLAWWRQLRHERGWRADLLIETHDSLLTAPVIARFLTAVPGARLMWDAHHTWRKGGEDPVATWRAIHAAVVHIHVKDSIDRPSARHPFTYVLPGDGQFPIAALKAALLVDDYRDLLSLEWERMWHPYLPPLEEALRVADQREWW